MQDYELANGDVEAPGARLPATPSPGMLQYMRSKEAQLGMLSMLLLVSPAVAQWQHSWFTLHQPASAGSGSLELAASPWAALCPPVCAVATVQCQACAQPAIQAAWSCHAVHVAAGQHPGMMNLHSGSVARVMLCCSSGAQPHTDACLHCALG